MGRYKNLFNNTLFFSISKLGSKFVLFLLVPLYTTCLTKSEYGIAELITTSSDLLIPIVTLGIGNAVYRFTFDKKHLDKEVLKCFYLVFFISLIIAAAIGYFLKFFDNIGKYGLQFSLLMVLSFFNETYGLYLKAKERTIVFAIDGLIYIAFLGLLNVLFLYVLNLGVFGYLFAMILSKIISIIYMMIFGKVERVILPIDIDFSLFKEMIIYSFPLIANSLFWWIMTYSDKYMLNFILDIDTVGVYTVASKIPSMITTVASIFIEAFNISYLKEYEKGTSKMFYNNIFKAFNIFMPLAVSVVLLIIRPFMYIYVSDDYYSAIQVIPYLMLGAFFWAYSSFCGAIFSAVKKSNIVMFSSLYGAIGNIILNFILIPLYGMTGAAMATMFSYGLTATYRFVKSIKYEPSNSSYLNIFLSILVLTIQMIFVSFNIYSYVISFAAFIVLIIININDMHSSYHVISQLIKEKFNHNIK